MLSPTEEIKSKLDIVDVVQEYVQLKQSGVNLKGLCPFHNEKTPSFMVSREKQFFKCFGCGEGGDMFTFLQKIEGLEFPEALKILAERAGVELKEFKANPQMQNLKTRLYDLHNVVIKFYQDNFFNAPIGKGAREYLVNQRGLDKKVLENFKIGYAPDSWDATNKFLHSKGFSDQEIKQSGLVVEKDKVGPDGKNYYDRFRDRIMFPIADHHGNVVGFTARTMKKDEQAKYINTPQTVIYNKSQILYGLDKAKQAIRQTGFLILVEGNMDVLASHKAGVQNVVASSGTSLTEDQIKILKRYTTNILICFDTDAAGMQAAERGVQMLWQFEMNVKAVVLPDEFKDPDELIQKNSAEWKKVINKKINFMDYLLQNVLKDKNLSDVNVKKQIGTKVLSWLSKLSNSVEQDHYIKILAGKLGVEENTLWQELDKIKNRIKPVRNFATAEKPVEQKINRHKIVSERLLAIAVRSVEYLEELIQKITPELIEQSYQPIYNELISYYTKNNEYSIESFYEFLGSNKKDLIFVFDSLKLLAENEFDEMTRREINHEFDMAVNFLKKDAITTRLKKIELEIRQAEQAGDRSKADGLMKEFAELSRELTNL